MTDPPLSGVEVLNAAIVAMLAPMVPVAILIGLASGDPLGLVAAVPLVLFFGLPIAAAHVLPFWMPSYLLLRRSGAMGWGQAAALGFACGGLPTLILSFPVPASPAEACFFAACGVVGGLAFHGALEWRRM
ncbi:MAG TPA: hypothetical protein VF603_12485 [Allosphingosinicella sp.]|jgi:hypothetical protein